MAKRPASPNKGGRPRKTVDLALLRRFCRISPTLPEIAEFLGLSLATVERRYAEGGDFARAVDGGRRRGVMSLRRQQRRVAMLSHLPPKDCPPGASSVLNQLCKQPEHKGGLGQSDRHEVDLTARVESWTDIMRSDDVADSDRPGGTEPEPVH